MMQVLLALAAAHPNSPLYVEDFRRNVPDWANGMSSAGDPPLTVDAAPAFKRAFVAFLGDPHRDPLAYQRVEEREILVGRDYDEYPVSEELDFVGGHLRGIRYGIALKFTGKGNGLHLHYGKTKAGSGTSSKLTGPAKDFGGTYAISNLVLKGSNAPGSRGLIIQKVARIHDVVLQDWGWHCVHITAGVNRKVGAIDGGISNANGTTLQRVQAIRCGSNPGTDPRLISPANPQGRRPFGAGLRIEGSDANVIVTTHVSVTYSAGWAIDDTGFLGNQHVMPHTSAYGHVVTDWEYAIATDPRASADEKLDFQTYGKKPGEKLYLAYRIYNPNARGLLLSPYVESAGTNTSGIVHVRSPAVVISGEGGIDHPDTRRMRGGELGNTWKSIGVPQYVPSNTDETWFAEQPGTFLSFWDRYDSPSRPYRFKYVHPASDVPTNIVPRAGYYVMDHGNIASRTALYYTGEKSYEGSDPTNHQLEPGRLLMPDHYRGSWSRARKMIQGSFPTPQAAGLDPMIFRPGDRYEPLVPTTHIGWVVMTATVAGRNEWRAYGRIE